MKDQGTQSRYSFYRATNEFKVTVLNDREFCLPERYQPMQIIGSGAYGVVFVAIDHTIDATDQKQKFVAIKKINQK